MHICEECGQEFDHSKDLKTSIRFCSKHCYKSFIGKKSIIRRRETGVLYEQLCKAHEANKKYHAQDIIPGNCRFCGKECHNQNSLRNHERMCKKNPNRKIIKHTEKWYHAMENHVAWNRGLTKETDERVKKIGQKIKDRFSSGEIIKITTDETRKLLSAKRLKYIEEHPDKNPYLLRKRNANQAELFFENVFIRNKVEYNREYHILGYFLDFAWPKKKIYLEIDGEQHYWNNQQIKHDIIRTNRLLDNGWKCICRIRWSKFQKLTSNQKEKFIDCLLLKIQQLISN